MNFEHIVIVDDQSDGVDIVIKEETLYAGPMRISDIELFESSLSMAGTPYLLVQCETTLRNKDDKAYFSKGYCLFKGEKKCIDKLS